MDREARGDAPAAADDDLDSIPVTVALEVGRVEMPIREIRQLAPGVLLPLGRTKDDAVDIYVNGKRIGKGSLVSIGDNIGVCVTRLQHDG